MNRLKITFFQQYNGWLIEGINDPNINTFDVEGYLAEQTTPFYNDDGETLGVDYSFLSESIINMLNRFDLPHTMDDIDFTVDNFSS